MGASKHEWELWLERLYNLRRNRHGSHERPHKPVLLLSIIDLLDRRILTTNAVPLSDELVETFKRYFAVVEKEDDRPTIQNPFFHLSGDGFWQLVPLPGQEPIYRPGTSSGAPSVAELRRRVVHGVFDAGFWMLMGDPVARHQLRESLIARYFPEWREHLAALVVQAWAAKAPDRLQEELPQVATRRFGEQFWRFTTTVARPAACACCLIRRCHSLRRRISFRSV